MNTAYSQEYRTPPGQGAYAPPMMHNPAYSQMPISRPPMPEQHYPADNGLQAGPPPPIPSQVTVPAQPRSCEDGEGTKYALSVVQQPQRARMCGFGDKDRRPITPPPCVRLIITDAATGKEKDLNDVEHGMFVLNVDLWSAEGTAEVNLVKHSQTSPAVSLSQQVSYGQVEAAAFAYSNVLPAQGGMQTDPGMVKFEHGGDPAYGNAAAYPTYAQPPQVNPYSQPPQAYGGPPQYGQYMPSTTTAPQYPPQNGYSQPGAPPGMYFQTGAQLHAGGGMDFPVSQSLPSQSQMPVYGRSYQPGPDISLQRAPISNTQPGGMFTRNLIGSLAASAFRLTDPDDRIGIWFVLQDLSVRTEGTFRLRFSFVNVGLPSADGTSGTMRVNKGKAPVLASCYSDCFTVYSAKKFPGVVESTGLSKCFATQGIKIPIRKDGQGPTRNSERDKEYDED
ncbi:velvet factor-domain-containing protein [Amylocarpus encephaloides]|uniref:Velvet factor-domain-containing protein n=1 Tax=Amylocarpus encephaloides TaxID=45428 RepID=A0A9P7YLB0_9HELO|nr:velvet factor-domain-containing protein [Amylocarpus encephaloides]